MINKVGCKAPFHILQRLGTFEDDLCKEIKKRLNEQYPFLSVKVGTILNERKGRPVIIQHNDNAPDTIDNSRLLIDSLEQYLQTRKDIETLLGDAYSLTIDLFIEQKKASTDMDKDKTTKDSLPVFLPINPRYRFDQIILSEHVKKEILDAVKVIECKDLIYNTWGFSEIDPVPRSVLNFYGEPGTGKTMCAHAIAHYLGKSILALNYSEIESKFVGEAPKNLQHAFDVAKVTDSVLFFDEADSFLGKRIENVTQGADQALNSLRSQMLILLEEFSGVVIFATNLVTNFDPAFESRILKHIRFELPNIEARAAILRKVIPPRLPGLNPYNITDQQLLEASKIIDGFNGREIKGAVLDMLLSKATSDSSSILFGIEDLFSTLQKKKDAKTQLKAEEENRLKQKIEKKIKEKIAENHALKEAITDNPEEKEDVDKPESNNDCCP